MTEKQHIAAFPAEDGKDWARKILIRIRDGNPPCSYAVNLALVGCTDGGYLN